VKSLCCIVGIECPSSLNRPLNVLNFNPMILYDKIQFWAEQVCQPIFLMLFYYIFILILERSQIQINIKKTRAVIKCPNLNYDLIYFYLQNNLNFFYFRSHLTLITNTKYYYYKYNLWRILFLTFNFYDCAIHFFMIYIENVNLST